MGFASRHDLSTVFSDFLQMAVCALSMQQKEELYLETIKRYEKSEVQSLTNAFASLVIEMDNSGQGCHDVLGPFFTLNITRGHNGQYFTPQPICNLMARCTGINDSTQPQRVLDPACGSGTMLVSRARCEREVRGRNSDLYFGADLDRRCAMMTAINLCLNGLCGEVAWMNSLSNEYFGGWKIDIHSFYQVPYLREISEQDSYIHLKIDSIPQPQIQMEEQTEFVTGVPVQQRLFDF